MKCRVCGGLSLDPVVDLGVQPWCNDFLTEDQIGRESKYPLRVVYCNDCCTAQLDYTVNKEIMFGNHTYLSGITSSLSKHFRAVAEEAHNLLMRKERRLSVLDIGSNDGTQLRHFKDLGWDVLGVESSIRTAQIANENGIQTLNSFFNKEVMLGIASKFDVINASGVFFHLEELHSVCEGIRLGLREDGIFIVQFLYMKSIIENTAFDQIYHEHLLYYTLHSLQKLLEMHDLGLYDAYLSPIHGGSIIGFVKCGLGHEKTQRLVDLELEESLSGVNTKEAYIKFQQKIENMKIESLEYLRKAKANGKRVYGFGAPVKGNTMLNYFGIDKSLIDCLVEKNKLRDGLFSPGMHIPIVMEDDIDSYPDIYYVFAWNFRKEILKRNSKLIEAGVEFYFPVEPAVD